ncbi:MAG TPA: endonuclease III [Caldilineae bacterium]|nr:endonuclease III [Caldilineae bacterium]HIQ11867.1 endonuclease III [Caldilineales bacterium]
MTAVIAEVHRRLQATYGEPRRRGCSDPVGSLVQTILSQNTSDVNTARSYASLRAAFPDWHAVMTAPAEAVVDAIRAGGLANQKAPRIQAALRAIYEIREDFDLSWLAELPVAEARSWLTSLPGVGNKTASILLLFCFDMPAFPVDTHVHRVTRRLGLAPASASPDQVMRIIEAHAPPEWFYPLHLNLIRHGRAVCKAQKPRCDGCVLANLCASKNVASTAPAG